jgi:two-component system, cell cycle response regulator DivK
MKEPVLQTPLVLVVEDDGDAREMYEVVLAGSGFRVASAANGIDAIDKARTLLPGLILMDLSLPSLDGWEASRRLKNEASTRDIPIVALSGNPIDDEAGAGQVFAAALMKPCLPDDLIAAVRRLVGPFHP